MSRLVDIDDERFWNILFDEACVEGNQAERIKNELEKIVAYDTEKVVAGLEHEAKLQGYFRQDACKRLNVAQGNIHRYAEQCYQNAIDIVKRGGIE